MKISRRRFTAIAVAAAVPAVAAPRSNLRIICAPSSLGLSPVEGGKEPGAWRSPAVLLRHGLAERLGASVDSGLGHAHYSDQEQAGTRIRNGVQIRRFSEQLADHVVASLAAGAFPIVLGGDCSILLGCLYGAARQGGRGLVHVDGHSDYFHPGNYDTSSRLGAAAGMDLALATGKGEALLASWPGIGTLVREADAIQIGERDAERPEFRMAYGDIVRSKITRFTVQSVLSAGVEATADQVVARLAARGLSRAWLHVDLDVLDESVLPAVDSPGTPGLNHEQLAVLIGRLIASGRICGVDFTIYDPDRDPGERFAPGLVDCIARSMALAGKLA